ncbi:hypothetical protein EV187_1139 [Agromyces ramosus]|uniref:Uncharacterized protein n=1 Tax=Agromyces ramosus TaxID=33879 RepID=A0A4Q7MKB5_9MICO|nr:hypothetical protein [Agromyces ramosus]RZS68704.1 hypothetical protein EV187_1139 [Agromyces ramosus]
MALFGYKPQCDDRYVPVSPAVAYATLRSVAEKQFKLKASDDFMLTVELLTTAASLSGFGERIRIQVVPSGVGSVLQLTVEPRGMSGGLLQSTANRQAAKSVFRAVSEELQDGHREPPPA